MGKKQLIWVLAGCVLAIGQLMPVAAQSDGRRYTVQPGDTLFKLAEKYLGDGHRYPEIVAATNAKHAADATIAAIDNPNRLEIGAVVWLPAAVSTLAPAVTPAGDAPAGKIAFSFWNSSPERCTYEIDIIDVAACRAGAAECQASRRIFPLNNVSEPALSPDGQRLAFRGWGAFPEKYNDGQTNHPYYGCPGPFADRMMAHTTLDGRDYYRLGGFLEDSHPDWSPDGQRLLFDTQRNGDNISRIMAISADGHTEETLRIAGQQPSWSPDNDHFVFRGCDSTGNRCGLWQARALPVEAWDLDKNLVGPVLIQPEATQPDWSPVSNQVVYQSPVGGSWDVYVINADGSGQQQLTNDPDIEGLPVWSPDGRWIAYLSNSGGNWGIWLMQADGRERRQLFAFDGGIFTPQAVPPYGARDWLDEQISWSQ